MSSQEDYSKEPTTTARVEYDEATKQQALERAKLPETIPDDKILQQRQLEASYSRLRAPSPSAVAEVDKYISYIEEQKTAKKKLAQIESSLPELKTKAEAEAKYETEYLAKKELAIEEAWLSQKRSELIQRNLSAGKSSPEMYKSVEGSINQLRTRNEEAQAKLKSATTQSEYKQVAWQYKDTMYGWEAFQSTASSEAKQAYGKFLEFQSMYQRSGGGRWDNTILGRAEYIYFGGSSDEYSKIVEADRRNIEASRRMSAGLRATGNAQIQQAQTLELQRLGGSGDLVSGAGFGATKVSETLGLTSGRVEVATTKALDAQTFDSVGLTTQEIIQRNKDYFEAKGGKALADYYEQSLGISGTVFNVDQRQDWVGSLESGFGKSTITTSSGQEVAKRASIPSIKNLPNPVEGISINQSTVTSNQQIKAQQQQQIKDLQTKQNAPKVVTLGNLQTPFTAKGFSQTDPRNYTTKSLMGTTFKATSTGVDTSKGDAGALLKAQKIAIENAQQRQYTAELRAGNIGLATALLNPQTDQSWQLKGKDVPKEGTSINIETYLGDKEKGLGYDLSKPELIPDSVFKPVKYKEARTQAKKSEKTGVAMGDLTTLVPKAPEIETSVLATRKEAQKRIDSIGQPIKIDTKPNQEYNSDKTLMGTGTLFLSKKGKATTVGASEKTLTVPTEKETYIYPWEKGSQQYQVTTFEEVELPLLAGGTYKALAPVTNLFDTELQAKRFVNEYNTTITPKVTKGNVFADAWRYADRVDLGETKQPETLQEQIGYGLSVGIRPVANISYEIYNLTRPENEKTPIVSSGAGRLIGGTIEAIGTGKPIESGAKQAWEYYLERPIRLSEIPTEIAFGWAGGEVANLAFRGGKAVVTTTVGNILKNPNVSVNVKRAIFDAYNVGVRAGEGYKYVTSLPSKGLSIAGQKAWNVTPQKIQQNLLALDKKLAYIEGATRYIPSTGQTVDRIGIATKANLTLTLGGRKIIQQARTISMQENPITPKTVNLEGLESFRMVRVNPTTGKPLIQAKFGEAEIVKGKVKIPSSWKNQYPVEIVSKNVIGVPLKDEGYAILTRGNVNIGGSQVSVGKGLSRSPVKFTNVPLQVKYGIYRPSVSLPTLPKIKAPKLVRPDFKTPLGNLEKRAYFELLKVQNIPFKIAEKSVKTELAVKEFSQKANPLNPYNRFLIKQALKPNLQAPTLPKLNLVKGAENITIIKSTGKIDVDEGLKQIEDLVNPTVFGKAEPKQAIIRAQSELVGQATPVKTRTAVTPYKTEFTYKAGVNKPLSNIVSDITGKETQVIGYTSKTPIMFKRRPVVSEDIQTVGEQVTIPFKDYSKENIKSLVETGKYTKKIKGKEVEFEPTKTALQDQIKEGIILKNPKQVFEVKEGKLIKKEGKLDDVTLKGLSPKGTIKTKLEPVTKSTDKPSDYFTKAQKESTGRTKPSSKPEQVIEPPKPDPLKTEAPKPQPPKSEKLNQSKTGGTTILEDIGKDMVNNLKPNAKEISKESIKTGGGGSAYKGYFIGSATSSAYVGNAYAESSSKSFGTTIKNSQSAYVGKAYTGSQTLKQPDLLQSASETITIEKPNIKDWIGIKQGGKEVVIPLTGLGTSDILSQAPLSKTKIKQESKLQQPEMLKTVTDTITIQTPRLKDFVIATTKVGEKEKQMLRTSTALAMPEPTITTSNRPRLAGGFIFKPEIEERGKKKVKLGSKKDFIGNVRLDSIYNVYKRRDITYGSKQVAKLEKQDKRVSKRVPNMLTSATSEMKKGSGKKKKKSETLLGFEFKKDKDEFNSFSSSLTSSKKGKKGQKGKKTKIRLI